ncbi:MAG: V-type ATP synthase subunit F [Clostridiales bacterium]|nr:V-type ATP synthase subunit F [Clostridiales bacterium]
MYKIGVVGDRDSILGFKLLGLSVYPVREAKEASLLINRLARDDYAVIFITETMAKDIKETLDRYKAAPFPAIIPIPNNQGSIGLGMQGIKDNIEKAIGVDILFEERG